MKKIYTSLMVLATMAMAFTSCNKEIDIQKEEPVTGKMKTITVKTDIETRTTLDANHENIVWSANDSLSIFNDQDNAILGKKYVAGEDLIISVPAETQNIYAHYPHYRKNTNGPENVSVYITKSQKQTNPGELNGYNYPMVAKGTVTADNKAIISLYPVASALALNIYHTGLSGEESVKSVKVTPSSANTKFTGSQDTDLTGDNIKYTEASSSDPITVTLTNPFSLGNTKPADKQKFANQIYVCLAKQSYANVKFEIETNKGTYTITSSDTPFDCVNNDFVPVNINLAKATKEVEPTVFTVGTEIASIFPTVKNGIKVSFAQGEGTNAPVYYSPFRYYVNNTITVSAGSTPLKGIEFTFAGGENYVRALTPSTGTFTLDGTTGTWAPAGSETSVTFTNGTTGQARFSSIKVTTDSEGTESVVTSTPTLSVADVEVAAGSSATLNATTNYLDGTKNVVSYSSNNTSVATVDSSTGTVNGVTSGSATITATTAAVSTDWYIINSASTTCTVTVTDAISYDDVTVSDWDYVFTSNPWDSTTGDTDLADDDGTVINWGLTSGYATYNSDYLLALSTSKSIAAATIKSNNVITNVKKVIVYAKTNSNKKVTLTVKAGNTTLGSETLSSVTTLTAYTFTSATAISGKVSIEFTEPDGGYQIKEIRINPVEYSITCATPNNGTISASAEIAIPGTTVNLTATPSSNYQFGAWDVYKTGDSSTKVSVTGNAFTMPAYNVTVSASFVPSSGDPVTVSMNSFSNISGNVGGDSNITYEASKGDAATAPAVNSNQIRIYQNGGLLTITAKNNKKITSITIGSAMGTTVQTSVDNGSYSTDNSIAANSTYTISSIEAETVVFKCTGKDKTSRLYLNSLSVTYR